jgi:hypothetical protein
VSKIRFDVQGSFSVTLRDISEGYTLEEIAKLAGSGEVLLSLIKDGGGEIIRMGGEKGFEPIASLENVDVEEWTDYSGFEVVDE